MKCQMLTGKPIRRESSVQRDSSRLQWPVTIRCPLLIIIIGLQAKMSNLERCFRSSRLRGPPTSLEAETIALHMSVSNVSIDDLREDRRDLTHFRHHRDVAIPENPTLIGV